jgi:hypothetical protein
VAVDGRQVQVGTFPISVNFAEHERLANDPQIRRRAVQLRSELGDPEVLLAGMDRLDYTKGIEEKLKACGELLSEGGLPASRSVFVQFATPTREDHISYKDLRERVEQLQSYLTWRDAKRLLMFIPKPRRHDSCQQGRRGDPDRRGRPGLDAGVLASGQLCTDLQTDLGHAGPRGAARRPGRVSGLGRAPR